MRIGYSFKNLPAQRTGADLCVVRLLAELQGIDLENDYYQFFSPHELPGNGRNFRSVRTSPIWTTPYLNVLWHQVLLNSYVRRLSLDIVHVPYLRMPIHCSCPMVTTVHDLAEFHTPGHHTVIRRLYRKYVLRFLARRASHIITISQNSRRDIHQICGVPLAKITVAYPGVDARFRPLDRAYCRSIIRAKYGVERPYILYVGAIEHPNKGLVRLIEDFGRLRRRGLLEYLLVIVGGERGGANRIHRAVQDAQLQNDIVFPGFVPFDDLPVLYNAAAVFVYPSLYEGFGLPPVEAMACGTPVACSNTSSLPEVVGGAAVTFDPHNPGEIADAIRALLTTESLRREKASLGFERVKRYSWQSAATATLAVYREVVNHHRGDL